MTHQTAMGWAPAPRAGLVPLYPYGFGTILGKAFAVLKGNPKVLLLFVVGVQTLAMTISLVVIGGVAAWTFGRATNLSPTSPEFGQIMAGSTAIVLLCTVAVSVALVGVTVIAQGIVIAEVGHASLAEKAPLGRLWRRVKPAFWSLVGFSLLVGLATTVAMGLIGGVLAWFMIIGTTASLIAFGVGIFLAIAGGAVLAAWIGTKLYLAPSAIVLEGAGPIRAIARSWRLTRGRFWSTFGVLVLLFLITQFAGMIISTAISFFAPLLVAVFVPFGVGSAGSAASGAAVAVGIILSVTLAVLSFAIASIMTIVTGSGGALAYIDARMRDEGIDLRMRRYIDEGGNAEDPYTFVAGAQPSPYVQQQQYAQQQAAAAQQYAQGYGQTGYAPQQYAQPQGYAPQPYGQPQYAPPAPMAPGAAQPAGPPDAPAPQPRYPDVPPDAPRPPRDPGQSGPTPPPAPPT